MHHLLLFVLIQLTHSYKFTTDTNVYISQCSNKYVDEYTKNTNEIFNKIDNIIKTTYSSEIIKKLDINNIIIIDSNNEFCSLFCAPNNIVISAKCEDIDRYVHREIANLINYKLDKKVEDTEWDELNKFGYIPNNYSNEKLRQGFISNLAMRSSNDDKAETFAEFVSLKNKPYDKILIQKFEILIKRLLLFDQSFNLIIDNFNRLSKYHTDEYYFTHKDNWYRQAINNNDIELVKHLYSIGYPYPINVICITLENKNIELLDFFIKLKARSYINDNEKKCIIKSVKEGYLDMVKILYDDNEFDNNTYEDLLNIACEYGHINIVKFLVSNMNSLKLTIYIDNSKIRSIIKSGGAIAYKNGHLNIANYIKLVLDLYE